jgi:hypothetical protein
MDDGRERGSVNSANCGLQHQRFISEQETDIAKYITIRQGPLFIDKDFKTFVLNDYFMRLLANEDEPIQGCLSSIGFVLGFKDRSLCKHRLAAFAIVIEEIHSAEVAIEA